MVFSCLVEVFGCYIYSILFFSLSAFKIFLCITGFEQFYSYLLYAVLFVFLVLGFCWICGFEVVIKLDNVRSLASFFWCPVSLLSSGYSSYMSVRPLEVFFMCF